MVMSFSAWATTMTRRGAIIGSVRASCSAVQNCLRASSLWSGGNSLSTLKGRKSASIDSMSCVTSARLHRAVWPDEQIDGVEPPGGDVLFERLR